jgi:hypothetical protein
MLLAAVLAVAIQVTPSPTPSPANQAPIDLRPQSAPPRALVQRALQAIGGMEALSGRAGLTVQYYTVTFGLGQEETSAGPARATITSGSYVIDWNSARRVLTTETRQVSGNVVRQRRVTAQGIGMLENEQGAQQPDPPGVVANVERTLRTTPEGILLAAVRAPSFLSPLPPKP